MRHSELWARLEAVLGRGYYRTWAGQFVMSGLGDRTTTEALAAGVPPQEVWRAVGEALELPAKER